MSDLHCAATPRPLLARLESSSAKDELTPSDHIEVPVRRELSSLVRCVDVPGLRLSLDLSPSGVFELRGASCGRLPIGLKKAP
jgi:hypothetical protein